MIVYEIDPKKKYLLVSELPMKQLMMISKQIREWIASDDPFAVIQGDIRLEKVCCNRPDVEKFIVGQKEDNEESYDELIPVNEFMDSLGCEVRVEVIQESECCRSDCKDYSSEEDNKGD